MNNRISNMGGVHYETGLGYRAKLTFKGTSIRSRRFATKQEATTVLNRVRRVIASNKRSLVSKQMINLVLDGVVSLTRN